jgi:DNA helicase-2/ATP-dependent DNA helicase PcrA
MPIKIKKLLTNDQINLNYLLQLLQSPLHEKILKYLNNEQAKIVLQTEGSILVSAVPGAGKTKVISCKVAYLIDYLKVDPNKILVITFTKKASVELRERIGNIISSDNEDSIVLGTFHSICNKFIRSLGIVAS